MKKTDPVKRLANVLMKLYAVYYFHNDKTPAQFNAMDDAANELSKYPDIAMTIPEIRKKYPPRGK